MFSFTTAQHIYCTNTVETEVCNWTVLTVMTQKLLLHVQLHNSTAHLLYKYCTNCTVCNWTVLTVITQKLLLHVQLHNRRENPVVVFWSAVRPVVGYCKCIHTIISRDQILQRTIQDGLSDLGAKLADSASHPRQRYFCDSKCDVTEMAP